MMMERTFRMSWRSASENVCRQARNSSTRWRRRRSAAEGAGVRGWSAMVAEGAMAPGFREEAGSSGRVACGPRKGGVRKGRSAGQLLVLIEDIANVFAECFVNGAEFRKLQFIQRLLL